MMSRGIVSEAHLRRMFDCFNSVDNLTLIDLAQAYGYSVSESTTIAKAYRSLVSEAPALSDVTTGLVKHVGIVGATSVPTAVWPYLLVAFCLGIKVTVKLPPSDARSVYLLEDILEHVVGESLDEHLYDAKPLWSLSTDGGPLLLESGFWDGCDRILVFGTDVTVQNYKNCFPTTGRVIGFGHLESVLLVTSSDLQAGDRWQEDLLAFGHVGCLAPRLIVPQDNSSPEHIADVILKSLTGHLASDIERVISLRNLFHEARVHGDDGWLSDDGMWLITRSDVPKTSGYPGQLILCTIDALEAAKCPVGSLSMPSDSMRFSQSCSALQGHAIWKCKWGEAQYPSMRWRNGGISVISALCT